MDVSQWDFFDSEENIERRHPHGELIHGIQQTKISGFRFHLTMMLHIKHT